MSHGKICPNQRQNLRHSMGNFTSLPQQCTLPFFYCVYRIQHPWYAIPVTQLLGTPPLAVSTLTPHSRQILLHKIPPTTTTTMYSDKSNTVFLLSHQRLGMTLCWLLQHSSRQDTQQVLSNSGWPCFDWHPHSSEWNSNVLDWNILESMLGGCTLNLSVLHRVWVSWGMEFYRAKHS